MENSSRFNAISMFLIRFFWDHSDIVLTIVVAIIAILVGGRDEIRGILTLIGAALLGIAIILGRDRNRENNMQNRIITDLIKLKESKISHYLKPNSDSDLYPSNITKSAKTLWICTVSGIHLFNGLVAIPQTQRKNLKEFHLIVLNPKSTTGLAAVAPRIAQNQELLEDIEDMLKEHIRLTHRTLRADFGAGSHHQGVFELRQIDYSPGFDLTIIDPHDKAHTRVQITLHGVVGNYDLNDVMDETFLRTTGVGGGMALEFCTEDSPMWVDHWRKFYLNLWESATSVSLETNPGEHKTTETDVAKTEA